MVPKIVVEVVPSVLHSFWAGDTFPHKNLVIPPRRGLFVPVWQVAKTKRAKPDHVG
jgi:hypothetical protein